MSKFRWWNFTAGFGAKFTGLDFISLYLTQFINSGKKYYYWWKAKLNTFKNHHRSSESGVGISSLLHLIFDQIRICHFWVPFFSAKIPTGVINDLPVVCCSLTPTTWTINWDPCDNLIWLALVLLRFRSKCQYQCSLSYPLAGTLSSRRTSAAICLLVPPKLSSERSLSLAMDYMTLSTIHQTYYFLW